MSLPKLSIKRPIFVTMFFLGVVLVGIITLNLLPVEMMPNISFGHITINIDVRGGIPASAIEKRIAKPVEEALGDVSHLKNILSISKEGNATIILEFEPGTNMDFAALEVREKFNRIRNKLPKEIEKPIIAKYEYNDIPIVIIAVTSKIRTPEELREIVEEKIKDRIQRIEGVARVEVAGGRESKILIEVDKYKLQAYSLPINAIVDTINLNNINLLAGEIKRTKDKFLVRTVGEFENLSDIENLAVAVTEKGSVIRIKDIAKVKDSYLEPRGFARVNTQPSVSLYIQKESLANTVKVASLIEKEVKELRKILDKDIQINFTFNQAEYVKKAIQRVKRSLLLGALLAFSVLFLFLRDVPIILTIAVAIPVSVLFTFALMFFSKLTLNLMTLSGLALGVGILVDNAIVVIENIFKKLENISKISQEKGEDFHLTKSIQKKISAVGTEEMLMAIFASTITTLAVFIPLVFINPGIRMLYSGLALTISFALCASLLSALTLVPMIISRIKLSPKKRFSFLFYEKALRFSLKLRYLVVLIGVSIFILSIHQAKKLEKEFIGIAEQNKFTIFIEMPTGTRLEITDEIVKKVEKFVAGLPEVKTVTSRVEPWSSKVYVELYPLTKRKISTSQVIEKIRPYTDRLQPAFIYFEEPQEVGTKEILVEIFGYDYEVLKNLAIKIAQRIQTIPRFTDVKIRMREGRPEMLVYINKEKAAMLGLSVRDIAISLHTQLRGLVATRYRGIHGTFIKMKEKMTSPKISLQPLSYFSKERKEAKELETIVRLEKKFRQTFEDLKRISLITPEGETIYLSQIADFKFSIGPSEIWRKNKSRMVQVSANTGGMALGTAADKVREVLKDLKLPKDYFWQFGGNYEKMIRNQKELGFAIILSLVIIYMILASLFESFFQPFIILITVPLAAIGAIFALRLTSKPVSIGVLIGAIMLGGIVVNNAIVLVDRINFLKRKIATPDTSYIVIRASTERIRPIIMTSLTTISGMIFMALDRSESSNLWSPLAITVIGGMLVSTFLTLFIVPSLYLIVDDIKRIIKRR